jgi:hypothetical protein
MSEEPRIFDAEILAGRGGGAMVEIPFSVKDACGAGGQVKVKATFDGVEYRGSIAPMGGGVHILGIRKEIRKRIGKEIGDTVAVTLERDLEPREVEVPSELAQALAADAPARARFQSLSYTHRREFAEWVAGAKKQETRDRRAARAIEMILAGQTR